MIQLKEEVEKYIRGRKYIGIQEEFELFKPKNPTELKHWYKHSMQYILANVKHSRMQELNEFAKVGMKILDFGGGAGTDSVPLSELGCSVHYTDVNLDQQEFIQYLIDKYEIVNLKVVQHLDGEFDMVIMHDVVEHLYDYRGDVKFCISHLKDGGLFLCKPSFRNSLRDDDGMMVHFHDKYDFPTFLKSIGLVEVKKHVWRKEK